MTRLLPLAAFTLLLTTPAQAKLTAGREAAPIEAEGYLGGEAFSFSLREALKEGPVVVYFFPAAFTPGCNAEAALFAEAAGEFEAAGASLIGLTGGNTDRLAEFSEKHCASAFPVAAASAETIAAYDAALDGREGWSNRTSYLIAPDGAIAAAWSDPNPAQHVEKMLAAVKALPAE